MTSSGELKQNVFFLLFHLDVCYTCGKPGHVARDCEEDVKCYSCGKTGHFARECPNENTGGGSDRGDRGGNHARNSEQKCYTCGQAGHMARDCNKGSSKDCYTCGQPGHISSSCPQAKKTCYGCGKAGHIARDCTQSRPHQQDMSNGLLPLLQRHMARDCTNDPAEVTA
ncbi:putative cellular nucleic acid-binding protein-like isoform X2 [Apostichopus japonicus]|uniref:Putative cellular nucleic acid-binding protein-like isoform X2 n=1 Tax=Stichopus japonicus TaxID=307972 RepID=A0A2G8JHL6_STIJA|nr:putative cellular nucleic acid-binding protein-like isoform X2 [Apostichopus japonicus]